MNAKQAARRVQKAEYERQIMQLTWMNQQAAFDIQDYVQCILGTVEDKSICPWCEEYDECQLEAKDGKGCDQWWLRFRKEEPTNEEAAIDSVDPADDPGDLPDGGSLDPVST